MPLELIVEAPGRIGFAPYSDREPAADEVLVHTLVSGIKHGTELNMYRGTLPFAEEVLAFAERRRELGPLFPLLYLNSPVDAAISDFAMAEVREFTVVGNALRFDEDERDFVLRERLNAPPVAVPMPSGLPLNRDTYDLMAARGEFVRRARG